MPHQTALEVLNRNKRMLRLREVMAATGASKSTLYAWIKDPTIGFPRPARLGRRMVAWDLQTVEAWLETRGRASAK